MNTRDKILNHLETNIPTSAPQFAKLLGCQKSHINLLLRDLIADFCMEWGDYSNINVRLRWEAWKASREAIEIKLPPKAESSPYEHYMPHYTMDADSVESAIRAAGIKVKE